MASEKDRAEHRLVVDAVRAALEPVCVSLGIEPQPHTLSTSKVWHLATDVVGKTRDRVDALSLVSLLHPTPAVCGTPREAARAAIKELEQIERVLYAGIVGWMDARGDGEWAVVLRCAEMQGRIALLFAGAGIVADSDPEAELAGAGAKFRKMPPPALLSTTNVTGSPRRAPHTKPDASCSRDRSPASATVGTPLLAIPSTVDTKPSMPLAPRFAMTRTPSRGAIARSRSRTGVLEATTNVVPAGRAAATSRAMRSSSGCFSASRNASRALRATASASAHSFSHVPSPPSLTSLISARAAAPSGALTAWTAPFAGSAGCSPITARRAAAPTKRCVGRDVGVRPN